MEEKDSCYHVPVMLRESLEGLDIRPDGIYVDVTFGGGGHSREILKRLGSGGELYGFDQDAGVLFYLYYQQVSSLFSAHFFMLNHSFLTTFHALC